MSGIKRHFLTEEQRKVTYLTAFWGQMGTNTAIAAWVGIPGVIAGVVALIMRSVGFFDKGVASVIEVIPK